MLDSYLGKVPAIAIVKPKRTARITAEKLMSRNAQRIIKLIAFFLLVTCCQVAAEGFAQKVTLSLKNAPLAKVFESITAQTGFHFFYNREQLNRSRPISIQVKDATVEEALSVCFKEQPFTYTIVNQVIVIKERVAAVLVDESTDVAGPPLIDVHGKVMNESDEPVAGVTVTIKGTAIATKTDANGAFALSSIDRDAMLVFTHISMETFELKVKGKTDLDITLRAKVTALGDVKVYANTGYQTIKPNEANGSMVVVDSKTLNQQAGTNILQRINGVASGVLFEVNKTNSTTFQSELNISVRGLSSINGPRDPLIVLDGFIYEGDINNINPNDVENVTILKDAAATSIWGTRAGNGVIVITTKKGNYNQRPQVSFNANTIISGKPDLFYLPQMSSADYIDFEQFLFNRGDFDDEIATKFIALTPATEIFLKKRNGQISAAD